MRVAHYMLRVARSLWVSPLRMRWYMPREIWPAMNTRSCVFNVCRDTRSSVLSHAYMTMYSTLSPQRIEYCLAGSYSSSASLELHSLSLQELLTHPTLTTHDTFRTRHH